MDSEIAMRAMLFGRKTTVKTLTESLKGVGIELVSTTEVPEVITLLKQEPFSLVLVDSLAEQAEAVCLYIREFGAIPLVLIVHKRNTDWELLRRLGADGFLPTEARRDEIAARLRVIWRRFLLPDTLRKLGRRPSALRFGAEGNMGGIQELSLGVQP